jgi:hypothetical protein
VAVVHRATLDVHSLSANNLPFISQGETGHERTIFQIPPPHPDSLELTGRALQPPAGRAGQGSGRDDHTNSIANACR